MRSTMMDDAPLLITQLLRHGARVHGDRQVVTWHGDHATRTRFAETAERAERLAAALADLGVGRGDVVGTFCWNHQAHVEAYLAVPCMGAVLHTLNIRLSPDQLAFIIADAGDKVIIVDDSLVPALAGVADRIPDVERLVVVGDGDASALGERIERYEALVAAAQPGFAWPDLDETAAAAVCHTTGTTGDPKGVVYSHRSIWTHTFGVAAGGIDLVDGDRALVIVPQFHANAWGMIHIAWIMGADLVLPERHLAPQPLTALIAAERPTFAAAVPTVWNGVLAYGQQADIDLSSLQRVVVGGAAVPRAMIAAFQQRYGVTIHQGWGMTETSPVGGVAIPPPEVPPDEVVDWRAKSGRFLAGIEARVVDDVGVEQPWDGKAIGELQVRGPWVTGGYHGLEATDRFDDGWLRTGDMVTVEPNGFFQIVDRAKDVIKSGGEWISTVDLEGALMAHDDVVEAAVIGVADQTWDERPLACVVFADGAQATVADLQAFLRDRVASWWVPERWALIEEIPKTSVGKLDKKRLRDQHGHNELDVIWSEA